MIGSIGFHIDLAKMMRVAHHVLQHREPHADPGKFTGLEDSGYPPIMTYQSDCVTGVELFLFRVIFVDENVIVRHKWTALQIMKASAHFRKLVKIQSGDRVKA